MILEVNIKFIYFEHFVNFKIQSKICTNKYYACTGNYECIYIHVHVLQKELHENDSFLVVTIVKIKLCS